MPALLRAVSLMLALVSAVAIISPASGPGFAFAIVGAADDETPGPASRPQALASPDLDIVVHSRDSDTLDRLEPMAAEHGEDCGPPPAMHHFDGSYDQAVYLCRDHVMTALNASGYGLVYLTPNHLVDFSKGEAVVRFNLSTFRASSRDWVDVWVTPFEDNLVSPLDDWLPDLQGPPRRGLHVRMDNTNGKTMFRVERMDGHTVTDLKSCTWCGYEDVLAPSQTRRDTFELRISRTHVKFWMPDYGITWIDAPVADFGWDAGVVQFGHHSYTPTKDCDPGTPCRPATWHWDKFSISPSLPFTAIKANERVAQPAAPTLTFPEPAPEGAFLRVQAIGTGLEVSADGGASWAPLRQQDQVRDVMEHFRTYWQPIPAGTTRVMLRGGKWYDNDWRTNYAAIWAPPAR